MTMGGCLEFINSPSRNHLVLSNGCVDSLSYFDVGFEISSIVESIIGDRRLSMRIQDRLNKLLSEHTHHDASFGQYLALQNLGVLFEPLLKIDVEGLFDRWSQNTTLFVDMGKGSVEDNRFYLIEGCSEQYSVSLQRINYIIV